MQFKLSTTIRIVVCAISLLLLTYSIYYMLTMKNRLEGNVIHCMSAFESQINNSRLQAKVTLYMYRGKGSVQISGDYISPEGIQTPVKTVSGIAYQVKGDDYHVRFTGNKTSLRRDDIQEALSHLLPFSLTSEDFDFIYQFHQQNEGTYLIRQNGIPILLCKKISRG